MALRPTTNLVVPQHLMLPKKALKERFLYVYTGAYVGSPTSFMTKLWAAPLFPSITNDPKFGKVKVKNAGDQLAKVVPSGYLRVKKMMGNDPHFVVSIPLFSFIRHGTSVTNFLNGYMRGWNYEANLPEPSAETIQEVRDFVESLNSYGTWVDSPEIRDQIISKDKVIQAMKLDHVGAAALKACLIQVRIQTKGSLSLIFADFKVTKEEAQQLTTTEWQELREIDLYPLLLHWITVGYGARGLAPVAAFPVSKIAFSLPPSHVEQARVNDLNLSIGPDGKPYYLPREVDKTQTVAYEDRYSQAGSRDDGSFALHDIGEGLAALESGKEVKPKLPHNMVVSIDWLNNKFAYTTTSGMLHVEDLTRFRPANASNIRTLMDEQKITDKEISWFVNMGEAAGVPQSEFTVTQKDIEGLPEQFRSLATANGPKEWFTQATRFFMAEEGTQWVLFSDLRTDSPYFGPLVRYLKRIEAAVKDNIEAVYLRYSVSTVMSMFPWLVMISHYSDKMVEIRADDETRRKAAIDQGVDPQWKMPSVPLIKKDMGLLPHQLKVQNIMKDDPDVAILPIQTGGGKTPSLLIDLLLRYKDNKDEPYLVLCPSHLVPNYVREAVYFTDGKLNVIALTNTAIRQNGFKRLQAIMEAAPRNTVVVVDLDYCLAYRARSVSYGTTPTTIFPVIEFLRQFKFGYVAIDEAHRIKGESGRNKSVMALIADIPKKRLASGTFVHDSPSDLARIIGALDPTIFGTREEFNNRYGQDVRGGRVMRWKDGAQREIMNKIKQHVVVAGAMRKEWAAFLPKKVEWIGGVNLTPAQQAVYEDILNETIEKIEEDAKTNKELQKFLAKRMGTKPAPSEESESELEEGEREIDEDEGEDMAKLLNPYLARLETFLVAPGADILGKKILKGEDLMSPKVSMAYNRIRAHLFGTKTKDSQGKEIQYGPFPGKILVFCNHRDAAREIFDKAPPDLKKFGVLYEASNKVECLAMMEKNPNKKWMVGIVKSMEEGLNLQFASRIIRVSAPWNPGSLEQSNARIERPEFKKEETRTQIFFDTIVANHCLTGDTLVPTELGLRRLDELGSARPNRSEALNLSVGSIDGPQKTLRWWNQGKAPTKIVKTSSGRRIQGTANHGLLVLRNGVHEWVHLEDLAVGDKVCVSLSPVVRRTPLKLNLVRPETNAFNARMEDIRSAFEDHILNSRTFTIKELARSADTDFTRASKLVRALEISGDVRQVTPGGGRNAATYSKTKKFRSVARSERSVADITSVPEYMDSDLGYALGLHTAEGLGRPDRISVGMYNSEPIKFFKQVIDEKFGTSLIYRERALDPNRSKAKGNVVYEDYAYSACLDSKSLADAFRQLGCLISLESDFDGKRPAYFKVIPSSILEADEETQLAFLAGFWEGDGSQSRGELLFCSYSEKLKRQLQVLLNAHGFRCSINKNYVRVCSFDSPKLWSRMVPYIKGPKQFVEADYDHDRTDYGVPARFWTELVESRFIEKRGNTFNGNVRFIFRSDDRKEVEASFDDLQIGKNRYNLTRVFQYHKAEEGHYDSFFGLLERISPAAMEELRVILGRRYSYEEVVSVKNGKVRNVYDLSISDGDDGKIPAYVANGLVSHNTYDITKQARLIAKVIAAAKFENADSPAYEKIPDVPIIPMNLETIQTLNSWHYVNDENPGLVEYANALKVYETVRNKDYEDYKQAYIKAHGSGPVMTGVEVAPTPPDAKLLKVTPYVPGLGLYNERDLGLIRLDEYLNVDDSEDSGADDEEREDSEAEQSDGPSELEQKAAALKGEPVHTEFGEGFIKHLNPKYKTLSIELTNGYTVRVQKSQVFLITRSLTSNKDIRNQILKEIGKIPVTAPIDIPADMWKTSRGAAKIQREKEAREHQKAEKERLRKREQDMSVDLTIFIANGFLGIDYLIDEDNPTAMKILQAHGFKSTPPYYYSKVTNYKALDNQMKLWKNKGLMVDPVIMKQGVDVAFVEMYNLLKSGRIKNHQETYKITRQAQVVNFYRMEHKPSNKKELFKPYPIIQDGQAYIALPMNQAGTREAMKYKRPSFRWRQSEPTLSFFGTVQQVRQMVKSLEQAGLHISNSVEVQEALNKLKQMKVRDPKGSDLEI